MWQTEQDDRQTEQNRPDILYRHRQTEMKDTKRQTEMHADRKEAQMTSTRVVAPPLQLTTAAKQTDRDTERQENRQTDRPTCKKTQTEI